MLSFIIFIFNKFKSQKFLQQGFLKMKKFKILLKIQK